MLVKKSPVLNKLIIRETQKQEEFLLIQIYYFYPFLKCTHE